VADALRLLKTREEATATWTAREWATKRTGWIFLTSTPELRAPLQPLLSVWLDLLVLRLMNTESGPQRRVWFVSDELGSLQKLPQLSTALTESRKSNNPVVIGVQGKSQVETLYGHLAEAMLSQPWTKVFLKTSEPRAAKCVSDAIGEQDREWLRESRTSGMHWGQQGRLADIPGGEENHSACAPCRDQRPGRAARVSEERQRCGRDELSKTG
jgi:type IV secretory pathway TraG/TraD family ATPase VirD4